MAKHNIVFTQEEFDQLRTSEGKPLSELPISDHEKAILEAEAKTKFGTVHPNMMPLVICQMVGDAVVCVVVPRGRP